MKRPTKIIWALIGLSTLCGLAAVINTTHYYRTVHDTQLALIRGIHEQDANVVRQAINNGANVRYVDRYNASSSPLPRACYRGDYEVLKLLIEAGAEPDVFTENGNVSDLLHITLDGSKENSVPESMVNRGQCIALLIEQGLDPNRKSQDGYPVFKAIRYRCLPGLKVFIESGANIKVRHVLGNTALHKICMNQFHGFYDQIVDEKMTRLILDAGYDLTIKNDAGETALDVAIKNKRTDLEKLIRDQLEKNK